jgi:hypothetical protein
MLQIGSGQARQGDLFLAPTVQTAESALTPAVAVMEKPKVALAATCPAKPVYHYLPKPFFGPDLAQLLKSSVLPAAVLFSSVSQVRDFYNDFYEELQQNAHILANTHTGGSNKLFHNFSINPDSIMMVTGRFILKFLGNTSSQDPVRHLPVKTLIVCHLPFEQFTHPYQEALTAGFANAFLDYSLPKAVYNLHRILNFFSTPDLKDVYLWDAKLAKPYAESIREYLEGLGEVKVD